jgi:hypothetical protein
VVRRHVRDFMTDDNREVIIVMGDVEQAGVNADFAAGERECVWSIVFEKNKLPFSAR